MNDNGLGDHCANCKFSTESNLGDEYFECHQPTPTLTLRKDTVFWCNHYQRCTEKVDDELIAKIIAGFASSGSYSF
jgi:hypothetical protein